VEVVCNAQRYALRKAINRHFPVGGQERYNLRMYNFRYLLVTIVSIFVSLAIGLLLGAAIAGSDLVRDTSQDMMDSLMSRLDDINATNLDLRRELDDDNLLAAQFIDDWAGKRLDGRTICIIGSPAEDDAATAESLRAAVARAGGATVLIKVQRDSFGINDEQLRADLEKLVPVVQGEDYGVTIARVLADEWIYSYVATAADAPSADDEAVGALPQLGAITTSVDVAAASDTAPDAVAASGAVDASGLPSSTEATPEAPATAPANDAPAVTDAEAASASAAPASNLNPQPALPTPFQNAIFSHYYLTAYLVEHAVIQITTDYHLLSEHTSPQLQSEQLAALRVAGTWQVPYATNGVINTLVHSETNPVEDDATAGLLPDTAYRGDAVALALTDLFAARGVEKTLPYPAALRPASADDEAETDPISYFALLAQSGAKAQAFVTSAREHSLAALVSLEGETDVYNTIALLSGGKRGAYGLDAPDGRFPALPSDPSGRLPFAR
jgi:hypothetical protein